MTFCSAFAPISFEEVLKTHALVSSSLASAATFGSTMLRSHVPRAYLCEGHTSRCVMVDSRKISTTTPLCWAPAPLKPAKHTPLSTSTRSSVGAHHRGRSRIAIHFPLNLALLVYFLARNRRIGWLGGAAVEAQCQNSVALARKLYNELLTSSIKPTVAIINHLLSIASSLGDHTHPVCRPLVQVLCFLCMTPSLMTPYASHGCPSILF